MKLGSKYDLLDTPHMLKYKQIVWKYALSTIIYEMQLSGNGQVKNPVSLSKNIFSTSNFFMHIFNISVTYLQSVDKIQWKL